jgi:hypothetical protein
MNPYLKILAQILFVCLFCLTLNAVATSDSQGDTTCPVSGNPVAPGDTISVTGPPNTQSSLGIKWEYQWTLTKENHPSDKPIQQTKIDDPTFDYVVPNTETATTYKLNLLVTAAGLSTCINKNCISITISAPLKCTITAPVPNTFCTAEDKNAKHEYSTAETPGNVLQRWWLLPYPVKPEEVKYTTPNPKSNSDKDNKVSINYNGVIPGKYVVFSGYYSKSKPNEQIGYCMSDVLVVAVPGNSITIQEDA